MLLRCRDALPLSEGRPKCCRPPVCTSVMLPSPKQMPRVRNVHEDLEPGCRQSRVETVLMYETRPHVGIESPPRDGKFDTAAGDATVLPIEALTIVPDREFAVRHDGCPVEPM